ECQALANNKRAGSDRAAELMGGNSHEIDGEQAEIDRNLAEALNGIGVNNPTMAMCNRGNLAHGLDDTSLVIRQHDRGQRPRPVAQHAVEPFKVNDAGPIYRYKFKRLAARLCSFDHRWMLDGRYQQPIDGCAFDREVVGLAAAA